MSNLEDERYLNILYLGACLKALNKKQEMDNWRQEFYAKENMRR